MRMLPSVGSIVGGRAGPTTFVATTGILLIMMLAWSAPPARGQASVTTFPLTPVADAGVRGTAAVAALGDGASLLALAVVGLEPDARYQSLLYAGSCAQPSASFTDVLPLEADAAGTATAIGPVRFRGADDIPLSVLTDGDHIIVLAQAGQVLACGRIPAVAGVALDLPGFIALATSAACTDLRNQLYVIDDQWVVWIAKGSCADASYRTELFGRTPTDRRCRLFDSIAGPMRTCVDDSVRPVFETITANDQAPGLGLGPDHQVVLVWSASP